MRENAPKRRLSRFKLLSAGIGLVLLSSCAQMTSPQVHQPSQVGQMAQSTPEPTKAIQSAELKPVENTGWMITGDLRCWSLNALWNPCGTYVMRVVTKSGGPGMGDGIVPADLVVRGTKDAYAGLGDKFQGALPSSGLKKFQVNNVLFTVGELPPELFGASMAFALQNVQELKDGYYQFNYLGELWLNGQ